MAIAGGATTAYRVRLVERRVNIERTTSMAIICAAPGEALAAILDGDTVTVQGSDMWALQELARAEGLQVGE